MRTEHKVRHDLIRNGIDHYDLYPLRHKRMRERDFNLNMVYQNPPNPRAVQMIEVVPPSPLNHQLITDLYPLAISQDFQHLLQIVTWLVWENCAKSEKVSSRAHRTLYVHRTRDVPENVIFKQRNTKGQCASNNSKDSRIAMIPSPTRLSNFCWMLSCTWEYLGQHYWRRVTLSRGRPIQNMGMRAIS